jgi:hypothetical protein
MAEGLNEPAGLRRASDENVAEARLASAVLVANSGQPARAARSPHARKFAFFSALLVGLAAGAVVVFAALLIGNGNGGSSAPWSPWHPFDGGVQGAQEIADHLAPLYRINGVDQLAVITVVHLGNPNSINPSTGAPTGLQVAVQTDSGTSRLELLNGNTVAYNLCGIGSNNCTIGVGKPSALRLLLLKREALELALYTFKYISGTNNVVAILPPGTTKTAACVGICRTPQKTTTRRVDIALLFLRDELQPFLNQPLNQTLSNTFPPSVPQLPLWAQTPEAGIVEQVTARGLFSEQMVQTQDGSNLIELNQLPPS